MLRLVVVCACACACACADVTPIGVFDSGLGGLTVLERLLDADQVDNVFRNVGRLLPRTASLLSR